MTATIEQFPVQWITNPRALTGLVYGEAQRAVLNEPMAEAAWREIMSWPGYEATPLVALPGLAACAGVAAIHYKDESTRFGLGSFKALGGAYAVYKVIAERSGREHVSAADLMAGRHRARAASITVCCATDGNHGRSVAWGAQMFGCRCVIYIHETVSQQRADAIARYGAEVIRTAGGYDDAVRRAAADAAANGWVVVSDTSYEGYTDIPRDVMHGYTLMADEAIRQLPQDAPPTHVFVQGGVGGVAAAVCARFWWGFGKARPRFIVVEPERAACLYASAKAGRWTALEGDVDTFMACLSCGEPSLAAWPLLDAGTDAFLTVPDAAAMALMKAMADGVDGDSPVVAGESAVAGLAGALAALADSGAAQAIGLNAESRILVFGTEGDTDPELYREVVGRSGEEVRAVARARL